MHASLDQLIQLRDQQLVEAGAVTHVQTCTTCAGRLQSLKKQREELIALPQLQPSPHVQRQIRRRLASNRMQYPKLTLAAATLVAAVLVTSWVMLSMRFNASGADSVRVANLPVPILNDTISVAHTDGIERDDVARTRQLIQQSQSLEVVIGQLSQLPLTPRSIETQQAFAALQSRLALLDYNLTQSQLNSVTDGHAQQLWQRRVNTLQNMVDIQHAELAMQGYHGFQVVPVNNFELDKTW